MQEHRDVDITYNIHSYTVAAHGRDKILQDTPSFDVTEPTLVNLTSD